VKDDSQVMAATVAGAVLGAVAGYLFFTPQGRALRRRLEPAIGDLVRELDSFRNTFTKASSAANEGWRLLQETLGEVGAQAPGGGTRYASPHQTSPF
jgi:hypothetical protein